MLVFKKQSEIQPIMFSVYSIQCTVEVLNVIVLYILVRKLLASYRWQYR